MSEKKTTPRPRHTRRTLETVRALETLRETPDNREAISDLADTLALWTLYMVKANPPAAAHVYHALCDAWKDNRREAENDGMDTPLDQETVTFHTLFLQHFEKAFGRDGRKPRYPSEMKARAWLLGYMQDRLRAMLGRLTGCDATPTPCASQNDKRVSELRDELKRIERLPENEATRFAIQTEIHRLEHEGALDEWPEVIAA